MSLCVLHPTFFFEFKYDKKEKDKIKQVDLVRDNENKLFQSFIITAYVTFMNNIVTKEYTFTILQLCTTPILWNILCYLNRFYNFHPFVPKDTKWIDLFTHSVNREAEIDALCWIQYSSLEKEMDLIHKDKNIEVEFSLLSISSKEIILSAENHWSKNGVQYSFEHEGTNFLLGNRQNSKFIRNMKTNAFVSLENNTWFINETALHSNLLVLFEKEFDCATQEICDTLTNFKSKLCFLSLHQSIPCFELKNNYKVYLLSFTCECKIDDIEFQISITKKKNKLSLKNDSKYFLSYFKKTQKIKLNQVEAYPLYLIYQRIFPSSSFPCIQNEILAIQTDSDLKVITQLKKEKNICINIERRKIENRFLLSVRHPIISLQDTLDSDGRCTMMIFDTQTQSFETTYEAMYKQYHLLFKKYLNIKIPDVLSHLIGIKNHYSIKYEGIQFEINATKLILPWGKKEITLFLKKEWYALICEDEHIYYYLKIKKLLVTTQAYKLGLCYLFNKIFHKSILPLLTIEEITDKMEDSQLVQSESELFDKINLFLFNRMKHVNKETIQVQVKKKKKKPKSFFRNPS